MPRAGRPLTMDTAGYSKWRGGLEDAPEGMSDETPSPGPLGSLRPEVWGLMGEGRGAAKKGSMQWVQERHRRRQNQLDLDSNYNSATSEAV